MKKNNSALYGLGAVVGIGLLIAAAAHWGGGNFAVLNPKGLIALKEYQLMVVSTLLMLLVIVPVYVLTIVFAWQYRASNKKAVYKPNWDHHLSLELTWWLVPTVIIGLLAFLTWKSAHQLDPFKPIASAQAPLTVQVVALQWRWLFIYPEQQVASLNLVELPKDRPINFVLTSDAPMNSFWIPSLGGQVYAMSGMSTQLHLLASETGRYPGSSANLSGSGFANMRFTAEVTTESGFEAWVRSVKRSSNSLTVSGYATLAEPSKETATASYAWVEPGLYDTIVHKYGSGHHHLESYP